MERKNRISAAAVYCGSHHGARPEYAEAARRLGRRMAADGVALVYGGSRVGLMRQVAASVKENGGTVIGVIPEFMARKGLSEPLADRVEVVATMQERKARMAQLADAFVALPGGYGTLEELFEVVTASQLGLHAKPIAVADIGGFYGALRDHALTMVREGFVGAAHAATVFFDDDIDRLYDRLFSYQAPDSSGYIESVRDGEPG